MRAAAVITLVIACHGVQAMPALWVRRLQRGEGGAGTGSCAAHPTKGGSYGWHTGVDFDPGIILTVSDAAGPRTDVCPGGEYTVQVRCCMWAATWGHHARAYAACTGSSWELTSGWPV
jgi:hypothetical protein